LIRSLRDQLRRARQELKVVTAKVDVALSKSSRATDAEKFLLEEIDNLGKSMKCESFELLICLAPCSILCVFPLFLQMHASTVELKPGAWTRTFVQFRYMRIQSPVTFGLTEPRQ
jgi:hypothetical protein